VVQSRRGSRNGSPFGDGTDTPGYVPPAARWWDGTQRTEHIRPLAPGNSAALGAIAVSLAYLVLAAITHIVFIGILPVLLAVRALPRRETLAPVAIAAAVVAVTVAVTVLTHL